MKGTRISSTIFAFFVFQSTLLFAQHDSVKNLTYSAYGECYYSYDFSQPSDHEKSNFLYNHKRHNEINTNLLLVKANYSDSNFRASVGIMAGNYAQYNLSAEPQWAQFIYEANAGMKLSKKKNIWLDIGIMPSHIGFESAISADCWNLTRSMVAENSPYYEAGIKLSSTNLRGNLNLAFLILNGWQHIAKPNFIQMPSVACQINYKASNCLTLNYSNFIGSDKPDSVKALRTYHNVYLQLEPAKKVGVIVGFDIGSDKYDAINYGIWYSPVVIVRYIPHAKVKLAFRGEYYHDKHQIIVSTQTPNGFQVSGLSSNFDYTLNKKMQFRFEVKRYQSLDKIFEKKNENYSITSNLTFRL